MEDRATLRSDLSAIAGHTGREGAALFAPSSLLPGGPKAINLAVFGVKRKRPHQKERTIDEQK